MTWADLGRWLSSPGFGGAAAVVAASLAFWAAGTTRRSQSQQAREDRWWSQARWAADLLTVEDDDRQALGIAALAQLVEEAPDVEAALFARVALRGIVFPGDNIELVDDTQHYQSQWGDDGTEEP